MLAPRSVYNHTYKRSQLRSEPCAGPPLPETLRLLAPLASKLEKLNLSGNELGGTITEDIAAFSKLTYLGLVDMGLEGACLYDQANTTNDERNWGARFRTLLHFSRGTFLARSCAQAPSRRQSGA